MQLAADWRREFRMRWLLVAGLLCLPLGVSCATGQGGEMTEEGTEEAAASYKCESCGMTSSVAKDCCGAPMVAQ